ncbi:hypothetical protein P4114_24830 [Pseudomonas aeruginosa]|nr:hypothetical protein [Pseudomonas aeruginosa]
MHSDRCRIGGRTVNQWLAVPGRFPAFLACLEEEGWIRRHADPRGSRFWNLIEGDRAAMFGSSSLRAAVAVRLDRWRLASTRSGGQGPACAAGGAGDGGRRRGCRAGRAAARAAAAIPEQGVARLLELMAPHRHHGPAGLLATRMFSQRWRAAHAQPE